MAEAKTINSTLLNEEDIPCAKLVKPIEQCCCAVLRRWLLCRGAKTSGKTRRFKAKVRQTNILIPTITAVSVQILTKDVNLYHQLFIAACFVLQKKLFC